MIKSDELSLTALPGVPMVQAGDDLAAIILAGLTSAQQTLRSGDILIVTSKIVSKAENRWLNLDTLTPSEQALELAAATGKDAHLVEAILQESVSVSRYRQGVLIVRHRLGFTSANAGIDHSNVGRPGENWVLRLPVDPDLSARKIRSQLLERTQAEVGVIISDTHGRPFRLGNVGVAVGVAGIPAVLDYRGEVDLFGRELRATEIAVADALASAAGLVSGEAGEGRPVVLARGLNLGAADGCSRDLIRAPKLDLYK